MRGSEYIRKGPSSIAVERTQQSANKRAIESKRLRRED
jgi:hypothetical protein